MIENIYSFYQNAQQDYGIGLLMDQGLTNFQAWTGDGTSAPYFHNMRTLIEFPIPPKVQFIALFILFLLL